MVVTGVFLGAALVPSNASSHKSAFQLAMARRDFVDGLAPQFSPLSRPPDLPISL